MAGPAGGVRSGAMRRRRWQRRKTVREANLRLQSVCANNRNAVCLSVGEDRGRRD